MDYVRGLGDFQRLKAEPPWQIIKFWNDGSENLHTLRLV
jgi:hypothetical protein